MTFIKKILYVSLLPELISGQLSIIDQGFARSYPCLQNVALEETEIAKLRDSKAVIEDRVKTLEL
jgi:hypothetical protein